MLGRAYQQRLVSLVYGRCHFPRCRRYGFLASQLYLAPPGAPLRPICLRLPHHASPLALSTPVPPKSLLTTLRLARAGGGNLTANKATKFGIYVSCDEVA